MSGTSPVRLLLAAAIFLLLSGCSRLDPRVSPEYDATAKATISELDRLSGMQDDLRQGWDGNFSGVEPVIWKDEMEITKLLVKETQNKRKTRGDFKLHDKLTGYSGALADEGIALIAHTPPGSPPRTQAHPELERAADRKRKARAALAEALRE